MLRSLYLRQQSPRLAAVQHDGNDQGLRLNFEAYTPAFHILLSTLFIQDVAVEDLFT